MFKSKLHLLEVCGILGKGNQPKLPELQYYIPIVNAFAYLWK